MNFEEYLARLKSTSHHEILRESTVTYLSNLPDPLGAAALHAAVLRWFNADVLNGILEPDPSSPSGEQLYEQLQKLPFAEEFAGRGHSFHERTRKNVLEYLWVEDVDFYRRVSTKAAAYFEKEIEDQNRLISQGKIEPDDFDVGIAVEMIYHLLIADQEQAIAQIDGFLANLFNTGQMGYHHDMIESAAEHEAAGRLSADNSLLISFWRIQEAYGNQDMAELEARTQALLEVRDSDISLPLKLKAQWLLADGLRGKAQYDRAKHYFEECYHRAQALKDPLIEVKTILGLGYVAYDTNQLFMANEYFVNALTHWVHEIRGSFQDDDLCSQDTPLNIFSPFAWHRVEGKSVENSTPVDGSRAGAEEAELADKSKIPSISYLIEIDRDAFDNGDADLPEDAACPVFADNILAEIWFRIGIVQSDLESCDLAVACVELATQMYLDVGELSQGSLALDWLERLGKAVGNEQYGAHARNLRNLLIDEARRIGDWSAELQGLTDQARSLFNDEKYSQARKIYEEAVAISERLGMVRIKAASLEGLANLDWIESHYERASSTFETALALYAQAMDMYGQASAMISLGDLNLQMRRIPEAIRYFNDALKIYRALRSTTGEFDTLVRLSNAARNRAACEEAYGYLALVLDLAQKDEGLTLEALALAEIAKLNLTVSTSAASEAAFSRALEIARRIGRQELEKRVYLGKIESLIAIGEYEQAAELCHRVIDQSPDDAKAHRHLGWAYEFLGDQYAADSLDAYAKAAEAVPDDWWVHEGIGTALGLTGDEKAAASKLRWVVDQIEKGDKRPHLSTLGWCYYHLGEYEKAEAVYRQEIQFSSHSVSSKFDLGLVLLCRGKYAEGAKEYERGIELINQKYPERSRLGTLSVAAVDLRRAMNRHADLAGTAECTEVLRLLEQCRSDAAETKPIEIDLPLDNASRCNHRALVYNRLGQKQYALIEYDRAIELEPKNAVTYALRAQLYLSLDQPDIQGALADMNKAIWLEPNNAGHYYTRAQFFLQKQDCDAAMKDINRALEIEPRNIELISIRAVIYNQMDRKEEVLADISRIIEIEPDNPEGYKVCADYHARSDNYREATNYYSKAIKLQPDNASWYNERACLHAYQADWYSALHDYNQAIGLDPGKAVYYYNRSQAYLAIDPPDMQNAFTNLDKAVALAPRDVNYRIVRAKCRLQQGNSQGALSDVDQALKIKEDDVDSLYLRAYVYAQRGDYAEAVEAYDTVIRHVADDPNLYFERGQNYLALQRIEEAIADFNSAIDLNPDSSTYFNFRALSHIDSGNFEAALADLDRSDEIDKKNNDTGLCYNILWRGIVHLLTGQDARHLWESAADKSQKLSDHISRYRLLALTTMFMGDVDTAQKHYIALLEAKPDPYLLNLQLGYLLRIKRLFPHLSDIVGLIEWFEKQF
jgi:tetratricopeptide (TPR) repeat protein